MISVASTVGIGIGYPLAGYLTDLGGIRAAYAAGLAVTVLALVVAALSSPARRSLPRPRRTPARACCSPGRCSCCCSSWARQACGSGAFPWPWDSRCSPLSCWRAGSRASAPCQARWSTCACSATPPSPGANTAMLVAGAGMYLLLTCITRYVQTPRAAGYGFGLDTFTAGLFLVPFSALGFAAGRISPHLRKRMPAAALLAVASAVVLAAFLVFAAARGSLAGPLLAMSLLGLGVGGFSAAMPAVILEVTPQQETASAMGVNQVVRSTGFSLGSTLSALILAAYTQGGAVFPASQGYATTAWAGTAVTAVALVIALTLWLSSRGQTRGQVPAGRAR